MDDTARARRRWFGMFFLVVAAGMLVWGQTVLEPALRGMAFILYWLTCLVFIGLALITAWLDLRALRRATLEEHRELLERTLREVEREAESGEGNSERKRETGRIQ